MPFAVSYGVRAGFKSVGLAVLLGAAVPVLAHEGIDRQISDLTSRIAKSPDDASLLLRRGELHRMHHDWAAAESDYLAARRLDPDLLVVDLCIGSMRLEQGQFAEARDLLNRYLARRPDDPAGWIARARALTSLGDPMGGAADYTTAIGRFHPPDAARPELFLQRARALASAGAAHIDEAIAGLDEGLALLGQPVTLQLLAIDLEQQAGRFDAALRRLDQATAISARHELWLRRRGAILERAGRPDEARRAYVEALHAVRALPPARRSTKLVDDLESELTAALRRLEAAPPVGDEARR